MCALAVATHISPRELAELDDADIVTMVAILDESAKKAEKKGK